MRKNVLKSSNTLSAIYIAGRAKALPNMNMLYELAFTNSLQSNIITLTANSEIISVNRAACKLLGYSAKELSTSNRKDIFINNDANFKRMLRERKARGHSTAFLTAIKKDGTPFPCLVTSAVFSDTDGIEKAITTMSDLSPGILKQKNIDAGKEKIVANNIVIANSRQKSIDAANGKKVADNIILALAKQKKIDTKNGKIIAGNIELAQSKSNREKQRYQKLVEEKTGRASKLKEKQIADAMEDAADAARWDIGKELHDNVNQLLTASGMYIEMAKREGPKSKIYLSRSSEYIYTAIEEIRKLAKGLTTDAIVHLGLGEAIENIATATMEVNPVKVCYVLNNFIENSVDREFKLNIYRIVQEQLSNILKHARAKKVIISLTQNSKSITLSITDNGVGFDVTKKQKGIGVDNIKSRAAHYNGTAGFISKPGQGCTLNVVFPTTKIVADSQPGQVLKSKKVLT